MPSSISGTGATTAWLSETLASRPLGHADSESDWTKNFDAFVFTKTMTGSGLVRNRAHDVEAKKDLERFQGDWIMAANESNGVKLPAERLKTFRRSVNGDAYTITIASESGTTTIRGRFCAQTAVDPR